MALARPLPPLWQTLLPGLSGLNGPVRPVLHLPFLQRLAQSTPFAGLAIPSLLSLPPGCRFAPRCPHAFDNCTQLPPLETRAAVGHLDRCWLDPVQKSTLRDVDGRIGLRKAVSS